MNKSVLVLTAAAYLTGCAITEVKPDYEEPQPTKISNDVAQTFPQILTSTKPIPLKAKSGYKGIINNKDPAIKIFKEASNYKLFELPNSPKTAINISSICSCFGFSKTIMPPVAVLLDTKGQLTGKPLEFSYKSPTWSLPVHYSAHMPVNSIPQNTKYLLVASDSRAIKGGKPVKTEAYVAAPFPMVIPIGINLSPAGQILISTNSK